MNELTANRIDMLNSVINASVNLDESKANDIIMSTYGAIQISTLNPSDIGVIELAKLDNVVAGAIKANTLVETTTIQLARIFARYYRELKANKSVMINGKEYKTQTALGELFGLNKQRASDYAKIANLDIIYDDNYSSWVLGRFVACAKLLDNKKHPFDIKDITPALTITEMDNLREHGQAIDTTTTESTENATEGTENDTEGTENATEGTENTTDTTPIKYNENKDTWNIKGATYAQFKAWIYEQLDSIEEGKLDKVMVNATISIKIK